MVEKGNYYFCKQNKYIHVWSSSKMIKSTHKEDRSRELVFHSKARISNRGLLGKATIFAITYNICVCLIWVSFISLFFVCLFVLWFCFCILVYVYKLILSLFFCNIVLVYTCIVIKTSTPFFIYFSNRLFFLEDVLL